LPACLTKLAACVLCLLLLVGCAGAEALPGHDALQQQIDAICQRYGAAGVSAAYFRDGRVVDTFSWGYATRFSDPMTADTKVRLASISKVMVGLAVHLSVERGAMALDDPLDELLGFHIRTLNREDVISARSILTHTSSIALNPMASGFYDDVWGILTSPGCTEAFASGNLRHWAYNNFAFYVLGLATELANGQTMDEILNAGLCAALDIDASFWGGDLQHPEDIATIYNSDRAVGLSWEQQAAVHTRGPGANGAVFAGNYHISARDLGKIFAVLAANGRYDGKQVLSSQVIEALEQYENRTVPDMPFYQAQPLRYRPEMYGRSGLFYHTGSAYGEYNFASYDPEAGDGVVVLSTGASGTGRYGIYAVCSDIAELLYDLP